MSIDFDDPDGSVFAVDVATLARTDLFATYVPRPGATSHTSLHVSGKAFERPGRAIVSTYHQRGRRTEWYRDKVLLVELAANPRIVPLADHHSRHAGYWTEPHATSDPGLTRVIFDSNWGSGDAVDVDAYLIDVPESAYERDVRDAVGWAREGESGADPGDERPEKA